MKNYLSFGGGVNSVALHLYLLDQGWDFEAVFVNHGTDWPETYEYLDMFQEWLDKRNHKPITVIYPEYKRDGIVFNSLYEYCKHRKIIPMRYPRWCTVDFKGTPLDSYAKAPAFKLLGYDAGESHRAKIRNDKGFEYRYPLIEHNINRHGCKHLILHYGLPLPPKSGCFICPYQKKGQWIELRRKYPDLFCKAEEIEKNYNINREKRAKEPVYIAGNYPLRFVVEENQRKLFKQDEYPPCNCFL